MYDVNIYRYMSYILHIYLKINTDLGGAVVKVTSHRAKGPRFESWCRRKLSHDIFGL